MKKYLALAALLLAGNVYAADEVVSAEPVETTVSKEEVESIQNELKNITPEQVKEALQEAKAFAGVLVAEAEKAANAENAAQ